MSHDPGAHHIQIDVHQTAMQMLIGFDSRCVISILPKGSLPRFSLVVFLRGAPRNELHALGNNVRACVLDQQVDMIGRDHVIEYAQTKALLGFEKPMEITATITRELQEKFSLMTAVRDMPDVSGQEVAVGAWHRSSFLEAHFHAQKQHSKLLNDAFYSMFNR
jgi:hypothetical protein